MIIVNKERRVKLNIYIHLLFLEKMAPPQEGQKDGTEKGYAFIWKSYLHE
jgi:hypothetical protein